MKKRQTEAAQEALIRLLVKNFSSVKKRNVEAESGVLRLRKSFLHRKAAKQ